MLRSIGPAIIVAAVVLGPGSILTSSKVGATFGIVGLPVVFAAAILMIAMVSLAARVGVIYEDSPCDELAKRWGRPIPLLIGLTLFTLVALFQSSNNIAVVAGLEPLFGEESLSFAVRCSIVGAMNACVLLTLYLARDLYKLVESAMKFLIGLMTVAFLVNFGIVFSKSADRLSEVGQLPESPDLLPLLGMIGTTFSVAGAFYQAYLVKERGWKIQDMRQGGRDAIVSISVLGIVTAVILSTSLLVFFPDGAKLQSVGDVAQQLEPSFGLAGKTIFCIGILAGALSSFLVNAMIGGTVLSDSLGAGSRMSDRWPLHLTALALLCGMSVAIASFASKESTVHLITFAQALTILGVPILAVALIYLGTRPELEGERKIPRWIISLAIVGFIASCIIACITASKVWGKLNPPPSESASAVMSESTAEQFFWSDVATVQNVIEIG